MIHLISKSIVVLSLGILLPISGKVYLAQAQEIKLPKALFESTNITRMKQWADSVYQTLSTEQQLAQLIMPIIYPSNDANRIASESNRIRLFGWGGILYQKGLLADQAKMNQLLQSSSKVPMLIALDGEWGLYMRLKDAPRYPRNMGLGLSGDTQAIYNYGREVARQCRLMGIHVNFAPTVDVNINPQNPVIGTRSFGEDPKSVARMSMAYAQGLEDGGVLSVAKHFPGHGDTSEDSHKTLPTVSADRKRMQRVELHPFVEYIKGGFGGIMTAHLRVPAYDTSGLPSSLSSKITTDLLKKEIGFGGLVFTDGLEMRGVHASKVGDVGVAALLAGNDILLGPINAEAQLRALITAVEHGKLSKAMVREKVMKVLYYKYRLIVAQSDLTVKPTDVKQAIWTKSTQTQLRNLWCTSLHYLKRSAEVEAALRAGKYKRIAIVQYGTNPVSSTAQPRSGLGGSTIDYISGISLAKLEKYDLILVNAFTTQLPLAALAGLAEQKPMILAYYTTPYKVRKTKEHKAMSHVILTMEAAREAQDAVLSILTDQINTPSPHSTEDVDPLDPTARMTPDPSSSTRSTSAPSSFTSHYREIIPKTFRNIRPEYLWRVDEIVEEGLRTGAFPGCQVVALHRGKEVYNKAFGTMSGRSKNEPVTKETIYDVASITKALAMTPAMMLLVSDGKVNLSSRVADYLTELKGTPAGTISIRNLLLHQSGLPAGFNFPNLLTNQETGYSYLSNKLDSLHSLTLAQGIYVDPSFRAVMLERIARLPLRRVGSYLYSDLNFILLSQIAERVASESLDQMLERRLWTPMGAKLYYNPLSHGIARSQIAPTQQYDTLRMQMIRGTVDDESAACMGGISGNAGLYATATELAKVAQLILNNGQWEGKQLIPEKIVRQFLTTIGTGGKRTLGFIRPNPLSSSNPAGASASSRSVGHFGFTGTAFWIDPESELVFVFLSNRTYTTRRNNQLSSGKYRPRLHQAFYDAMQ